jgi:hypothetical protein
MSATIWEKSDWPLVGVCIALSGFGLSAVPFIGTKYGDWPEATALAIGLLPLIYIAIHMSLRFNSRLNRIEKRLLALEGVRGNPPLKLQSSAAASIASISASDRLK